MGILSLDGVVTRKQEKISPGTHRAYKTYERQRRDNIPLLDHGLSQARHSSQPQDCRDNNREDGKKTEDERSLQETR